MTPVDWWKGAKYEAGTLVRLAGSGAEENRSVLVGYVDLLIEEFCIDISIQKRLVLTLVLIGGFSQPKLDIFRGA